MNETVRSNDEGHVTLDDVDGGDRAAAWAIIRRADGVYAWAAWSDWTRAHGGSAPEVRGVAPTGEGARARARSAARSMNPGRVLCLRDAA